MNTCLLVCSCNSLFEIVLKGVCTAECLIHPLPLGPELVVCVGMCLFLYVCSDL